ncbi:MAG TPA: hypothetical protein VNX25_03080 [Verrucomicrobiae bacterium]|nr:hypothetical protein [Verrucomicrobiae bacterium]
MPAEPWAMIAVSAFWGWVAASIFLCLSTVSPDGVFRRRKAGRLGGVVVFLFIVWVVAMTFA